MMDYPRCGEEKCMITYSTMTVISRRKSSHASTSIQEEDGRTDQIGEGNSLCSLRYRFSSTGLSHLASAEILRARGLVGVITYRKPQSERRLE